MAETELERLWRESSARLRAWFERHTRNASDAEDLVQETFVRVDERLDTLRDAASLRAWVGRIARNVLIDFRRRVAVREHGGEAEHHDLPELADEANLDATVAGWLEDYLAELDPTDAEALRLVDLEGKTQREFADLQGLSLPGAKSRVQRARERLRARLEACCTFAFDARGGIIDYRKRREDECGPSECSGEC